MSNRNPLKFETERLRKGPQTYDVEVTAADLQLLDDPEYLFTEPVQLHLMMRMVGQDTVLLQGWAKTIGATPCARCLESLRVPLKANFTLTFLTDEKLREPEKYPELQDDNTFWYDGESIEPIEQLRELLLLELPTIPACELDDKNLCPITGLKMGDWVFGDESISGEAEDPTDNSLAAQLKRLRKQQEG
jgi:uncharacterized metal-binding protein YceD (DUF177 family)